MVFLVTPHKRIMDEPDKLIQIIKTQVLRLKAKTAHVDKLGFQDFRVKLKAVKRWSEPKGIIIQDNRNPELVFVSS